MQRESEGERERSERRRENAERCERGDFRKQLKE